MSNRCLNSRRAADFTGAKPITLPDLKDYPSQYQEPIYWVAKTSFNFLEEPVDCDLKFAVDRHYELFVNGKLVHFQRNFFNGDSFVYAQELGSKVLKYLNYGLNTIEVVIRTDPWENKNHRTIYPMLILKGRVSGISQNITLISNKTWQVATVENWREQMFICGCGTSVSERVNLVPSEYSILSGFRNDLHWTFAKELGEQIKLPEIFLWTEKIHRTDTYVPRKVLNTGWFTLPANMLQWMPSDSTLKPQKNVPIILECHFKDVKQTEFSLSCSALLDYEIELNSHIIGARFATPDTQEMCLPDYLVPVATGVTQTGNNTLRIKIYNWPCWHKLPSFLLTSDYGPSLKSETWQQNSLFKGIHKRPLNLSESLAAKLPHKTICPGPQITPDKQIEFFHGHCGAASLVMDLGATVNGRFSMKIQADSPGKIYLAFGTRYEKGATDCQRFEKCAVNELNVQLGESSFCMFDCWSFRYVDILAEGFCGKVSISDVNVKEEVFVDETKSSFESSNCRIDGIWKTARRTAQLCSDELYVDNLEREHAQWADAIGACCQVGYYCFSEYNKPAKALSDFIIAQTAEGELPGYSPGLWFPRVAIQDHMAVILRAFYRHFMQTGDLNFARKAFACAEKVFEHWEKYRTRDGLLSNLNTVFVDWGYCKYSYLAGESSKCGVLTAMNGYYIGALESIARLAKYIGENNKSEILSERADEVRTAMRNLLFDKQAGLFRDGIDNHDAEKTMSQPANCLAVQYGAAPQGREQEILNRIFCSDTRGDIIYCNALFATNAAEALFENGCDQLAINWISEKFGKMLDDGYDTFWETWSDNASVCQATGSGPASLFSRYIAGLYPAKPAYEEIGIDPHMGDIKRISTVLSTFKGPIGIDLHQNGGAIECFLKLPVKLKDKKIVCPEHVIITKQYEPDKIYTLV